MTDQIAVTTQFKWSMVPDWIMDHPNLSDGAVRCYTIFARYANSETHLVWVSQNTLSARMDKNERTIRGYITELKEVGALIPAGRLGYNEANVYELMQAPSVEQKSLVDKEQKSRSERAAKNTRSTPDRPVDRKKTSEWTGKKHPPIETTEREIDTPVVPKGTTAEFEEVPKSGPPEATSAQALSVQCPKCQAPANEPCRRVEGKEDPRGKLHRARYDRYAEIVKSHPAAQTSREPFTPPLSAAHVKDQAIAEGRGCEPCDTTGVLLDDNCWASQCRDCNGNGYLPAPQALKAVS